MPTLTTRARWEVEWESVRRKHPDASPVDQVEVSAHRLGRVESNDEYGRRLYAAARAAHHRRLYAAATGDLRQGERMAFALCLASCRTLPSCPLPGNKGSG